MNIDIIKDIVAELRYTDDEYPVCSFNRIACLVLDITAKHQVCRNTCERGMAQLCSSRYGVYNMWVK